MVPPTSGGCKGHPKPSFVFVPGAAITKYHRLRSLKHQTSAVTVQEVPSLKSTRLKTREESFLASS